VLIPYAFYLSKKSLADLSSWRRWSTFGLRSAIILLLVLSLAGFQLVWRMNRLCVIFALDVSNSIPESEVQRASGFIEKALEGLGETDEAGLVVFGKEAYVELPPSSNTRTEPGIMKISGSAGIPARIGSVPSREYTNPGAAVRVAMDIFPEASQKRIVLMTDGNENVGNVLDEAVLAKSGDVQIYTVPLSTRGEDIEEVLMDGLIGPGNVDLGRAFELRAIVKSTVDGTARLRLFRDRDYLDEKEVAISSTKKNVFTFPQVLSNEGTYVYEVLIEPSVDTIKENNRARALVIAAGRPKTLYITPQPETPVPPDEAYVDYLHEALAQKGMEVVVLADPSRMPISLSEMQNYSTVIFNDIPAYSVSMAQMKMIESYVHDLGGGFVMIGGENSFGSGGYHKTPIEELLPVKMVPEQKKRSLSIVLAIDKSGSMAVGSGRYVKIDLAKEAAVSVVEFLTDKDYVGVIAFDAEAHEIVKLEKVRLKGKIEDKIGTIQVGGGTNIYPALEIAHKRLLNADTQLKHVILVSDGKSQQPDDSYALVGKMAQDRITVSTIAIGGDADRELMRDIANLGLGRHYETDDAGDLPRIFVKEAFVASKLIMEADFRPVVSEDSEILRGIVEETQDSKGAPFPPLRGYVRTSAKETASVPITSDQGDSILSAWQYGLGRTLAFTSDVRPKWAVEWLKWNNFGKFWSQAIGWTLAIPSGEFDASASIVGGLGHVTVDAVDSEGRFRNFLDFQANVVRPDLSHESVSLRQSGPGRYEAEFDAGQMGTYILRVSEMKDGKATDSQNTGAVVSYSPEYKDLETNHSLLENLAAATGGKFRPGTWEIAMHSTTGVWQLQDLWRSLILASIPLFFLDVALRRITISKEQISELRNKLRLRKGEGTPDTKADILVNLRRRKKRAFDIHAPIESPNVKRQTLDVRTQDARHETQDIRHEAELSDSQVSGLKSQVPSLESSETYTSRLLEAKKRAKTRD
jgi:Ca-activated chloride channel family protein